MNMKRDKQEFSLSELLVRKKKKKKVVSSGFYDNGHIIIAACAAASHDAPTFFFAARHNHFHPLTSLYSPKLPLYTIFLTLIPHFITRKIIAS